MSLFRRFDPERVGGVTGPQEIHRRDGSWVMAVGTLACPQCDAPVSPAGPLTPAGPLECPFCLHAGRVRDFLSLEEPTRPARVEVRVLSPVRPARAAS